MDSDDDGRRSLWLTVPLYLVVAVIVAADVWGALFWARVGGVIGMAVAAVGALIAVVLLAVLVVDLRRHLSR